MSSVPACRGSPAACPLTCAKPSKPPAIPGDLPNFVTHACPDTRTRGAHRRRSRPWPASSRRRAAASATSRLVCYGEGVPGDTGCAYRTKHRTETIDFKIVTRGRLDVRNRDSAARPSPVVESREYRLRWAMQPQDYVVEKGHRLGVVLNSTDHDYTLRNPPGTRMTVRTGLSSVTLPVAPPAGS
ncbi:CocE/NonD family hydrolase C-terminal non-catalytic domain-containing protein [Streptomyces sp. NPDC002486]